MSWSIRDYHWNKKFQIKNAKIVEKMKNLLFEYIY